MKKILVGYCLSKNIIRYTSNKSEQIQLIILNTLSKNQNICKIKLIDKICPDIHTVINKVHNENYIRYLLLSYITFKADSVIGITHDYEFKINDMIGLIPNAFISIPHVTSNDLLYDLKSNLPLWKHINIYSTDYKCPIFEHTADDVLHDASATLYLTRRLISSNSLRCVYSLTSNPGHHAGRNFYGGYCFINNAMIAAVEILESGDPLQLSKVFILDLDHHVGDGTNDIVNHYVDNGFGDRLMTASIHIDPMCEYPYLRSQYDNNNIHNILLPPNCGSAKYMEKLSQGIVLIQKFKPDYLILAFGCDTYSNDSEVVTKCKLLLEDYSVIGNTIGALCNEINCKLIITQECGYCLDDVGIIVNNLLNGINKNFN